jgi:hypothetical protein
MTDFKRWIDNPENVAEFERRITRDCLQYWEAFKKPLPMKLVANKMGRVAKGYDVFAWFITVQERLGLIAQLANSGGRYVFPLPAWNSMNATERKRFQRMGARYELRTPEEIAAACLPPPPDTVSPPPLPETKKFF